MGTPESERSEISLFRRISKKGKANRGGFEKSRPLVFHPAGVQKTGSAGLFFTGTA